MASQLPLGLKLGFTAWVLIWAPSYWVLLGPDNFLWLCDLASLLLWLGLLIESRRLVSMQLLAVTLVGALWTLDVAVAALIGMHPIGGTEYMFDSASPALVRGLSLFHLWLPVVAGYAVWRLGYDHRAIYWQTGLTWLVIPLSYWLTAPEHNINWVQGPFGQSQTSLEPCWYLVALMLAWPLVLYLPIHLLMLAIMRWRSHHRGA
ncbi:hypothetical protein [Halomonas sp. YLGW01]|uniref:hypothetical protein n=1 Tax=Halomonas sp. YLGW01 TaxID=2773308 RepID=UPI00177CEC02|nr:hypothetical protein [Halomonas sp. YLGW01]